jgi:16S rRNA (guanine527-N7)-methyltransferase
VPLSLLAEQSAAYGFELTLAQLAAFEAFQEALYAANQRANLTRVPRDRCEVRHFADSLLFASLIPANARVLDVGCGAGFPAWPIACARPDVHVTALDSSGKAIGFLRTQALPNLVCHLGRAEQTGWRERFDVVTGRALAPLAAQLELSAQACRVGGLVLPLRTASERAAIASFPAGVLGLSLREIVERRLAGEGELRACPVFEKVRGTPRRFPRKWADIRRHPLSGDGWTAQPVGSGE